MKKIRNNWKLKEVLNLFNMPFNELLFEAHNSHIKNHKKDIKMSFFPERFVQGLALEEFNIFPHIIGSINKKSEKECIKFLNTRVKLDLESFPDDIWCH